MKYRTILMVLLLLATEAQAATAKAPACPTAGQAGGDAALKLAAMLRVTGLMCHGPNGQSLFPTYQMFTKSNGPQLKAYQDQLLAAYRAAGRKDPDKALYSRETEVGNDVSLAEAKAGTGAFCSEHVPQLESASVASRTQIIAMVEALVASDRPKECPQ